MSADKIRSEAVRPRPSLAPDKPRTLPVVEVFGPTIQGEGALAGLPTMFVRLGYCDYRCEWCDSMFAVDPGEVREHSERLTAVEVVQRLGALAERMPTWVTLSGGNPAIHDCHDLVSNLQALGCFVCVETQGSVWRDWLRHVDMLTISPKPPSSGMVSDRHTRQTRGFLDKAGTWVPRKRRSLKIVVFDQADLDWARTLIVERIVSALDWWDVYLSVGTDRPGFDIIDGEDDPRPAICDRYRWLCERAAADPILRDVRVLPQLHVLAWGHTRGV